LILMVKCVSFTKTHLLIIVSGQWSSLMIEMQ